MIVYVESNFVLEMAREQEQAASAKKILELAEDGKIELAFPGFALSEPFSTVIRNRNERNELYNSLVTTLKQLQRSEPHKQIMVDLEPVLVVLDDAIKRDLDSLYSTIERMLSIGRLLETDVSSFRQAVIYQKELGLSELDSIIYSTIITDLGRRPYDEVKRFLSRDKQAFATNRGIKSKLRSHRCSYIGNFTQGLDFIEHAL
jgi:predicted nucleic acid-binding protein